MILLGIVGEFATVIVSVAITLNAGMDSVLEISKNGYKIEKSVLEEFQKKQEEAKRKKKNLGNRILGAVLLLVPGVNLINASVKWMKLKKSVMNDPQIKKAIVPMTEREKEQYAKMKGKLQKLTFMAFTSSKESDEKELLGFVGNRPMVVDYGLTSLYYEPLMPLDYTLEEVKRLNEVTTHSYRIGKIDGKNVAIIGIPNPNCSISRMNFKAEGYKGVHIYEKMTEEEAKDKTFTVYPFMPGIEEKVEEIVASIKQSRVACATKEHLEELKVPSMMERDTVLPKIEQDSPEEQGPRLVKTMRPQNRKK